MSGQSPGINIYSSDGYELSAVNGVAIPVGSRGLISIGSDGTNARFIKTDTFGNQVVVGLGTGGTPAGGVITIQGTTNGTAVVISGTVISDQGTTNTLSNAWSMKITDATNGPAAIKASSTAPSSDDPALVVVLSPNQQAIPITIIPAVSFPGIAIGYVVTAATTKTAVIASTYIEQTNNAQRSFKSSSASDTATGVGARAIILTYYDQTMTGPNIETITLNGTTAVNTVGTNIAYVESIMVTMAGTSLSNVGTISMFTTTAGGGITMATINIGDNKTFWGNHYVSNTKTCFITGLSGHNTNSNNGSVLTLTSHNPMSANSVEVQISDFVRVGGGTSQPVREYSQQIKIVGPARIRLYETCEGTASITTRASFDYYDQ